MNLNLCFPNLRELLRQALKAKIIHRTYIVEKYKHFARQLQGEFNQIRNTSIMSGLTGCLKIER